MAAGSDHVQRRFGSDQSWQALRAAAAGNDADQHLGQSDLRVGDGDAVVAGHGVLQPAAEGIAVDRRDDGLLHIVEQIVAAPLRWWARFVEAADVGAGDEAAPRADHDERLHVRIGVALLERLDDAFRHAWAKRVDRRVVDRDDADPVLDIVAYDWLVIHGASSRFYVRCVRRGASARLKPPLRRPVASDTTRRHRAASRTWRGACSSGQRPARRSCPCRRGAGSPVRRRSARTGRF